MMTSDVIFGNLDETVQDERYHYKGSTKYTKKDGNGSDGRDLIVDNLHFLKKQSYKCMVQSN